MFVFFALLLFHGVADRIVAKVDTDPILESDVEAMVHLSYLENPMAQTAEDSLEKMILDRLISQKLMFKKAAQDTTMELNYGEISAGVEKQLDFFYSQLDSFPEARDSLVKWDLTRERLRGILMNEGKFQAIVQHMLLVEGKSQPYVSPNEVRKYYDEHKDSIAIVPGYIKMAHIALMITPSKSEMTRIEQKFNDILTLLSRGGEFDLVAESFSEDPKTASKGGALGWVKRGELPAEIDTVLFSIPVGQPAGPVQTREGFNIFLVERRLTDKVYARQILLKPHVTREDTIKVMRQATLVRDEILSGELTFEEAAKAYSEDYTTKDNGGYIGEALIENLTPPFDSVAEAVDSGQISQPFVSDMGVHILYAIDKRAQRILTFDEVQSDLRNFLAAGKQEEWIKELVDEARSEFYVEETPL